MRFDLGLNFTDGPLSAFNAIANIRAVVVLPTPLGPVKIYPCPILFCSKALDNVWVT